MVQNGPINIAGKATAKASLHPCPAVDPLDPHMETNPPKTSIPEGTKKSQTEAMARAAISFAADSTEASVTFRSVTGEFFFISGDLELGLTANGSCFSGRSPGLMQPVSPNVASTFWEPDLTRAICESLGEHPFPNDQVHVIDAPYDGSPGAPVGPYVSYCVDDLASAETELTGVSFSAAMGEGASRILWFTDPAGNTEELQQDPEA